MSLYQSIVHGKEHRNKFYLNSNKFCSKSCRNHGTCDWCQGNRLYNQKRDMLKVDYQELEDENINIKEKTRDKAIFRD